MSIEKEIYVEECIQKIRAENDNKAKWMSWEQFIEDNNVIRGQE